MRFHHSFLNYFLTTDLILLTVVSYQQPQSQSHPHYDRTQFTNKKTNRNSHAYRVTYRSMDRSLTNEEVNGIQDTVRSKLVGDLKVELR
jgi:hypothetical protein